MAKENNPPAATIRAGHDRPAPAIPRLQSNEKTARIISLDLLRGLVMVIMALDHVRDFTHYGTFFNDPTNLATTSPALFFTRWITHFCAPVFVFLAGASAFLYGVRQGSTKALSRFLLTRGLWLIFIELTVVNLGISFDISFNLHIFQVIWAIGLSMVCLSGLVYLPKKALLATGILIVAGHNLLDGIAMQGNSWPAVVWYFLHQANFLMTGPDTALFIVYPVLPWIGVMALGYVFGHLYRPGVESSRRKAFLWKAGLAAIGLFVLLRTFNLYGDPRHWAPQKDVVFSVLSFLNTSKYPPSLLYLLMTLGPAMLFLYWAEDRFKRPQGFFATIGRVPFFYYILHFYVVHLLSVLGVLYAGLPWSFNQLSARNMTQPPPELLQYGYPLTVTYGVWIAVIAIMYPLCKWYDRYKRNNRDKWWLSYL